MVKSDVAAMVLSLATMGVSPMVGMFTVPAAVISFTSQVPSSLSARVGSFLHEAKARADTATKSSFFIGLM